MKPILTPIKCISVIALLALAVGCASTKQTENMLSEAGFKIIADGTAQQQEQIKALPPGKVTVTKRNGKTYYVFPDVAHNQVYVGRQKQYEAYQQILSDNKIAAENRATINMFEDAPLGSVALDGQDFGD
jgi:hypothetical protein